MTDENTSCKIIEFKQEVINYNVYLSGEISSDNDYSDFFKILRHEPGTLKNITLYINSPGGELDVALQIISAVKDSPHPVYAIIDGSASSAATLIALGCPQVSVSAYAEMMIHNASSLEYGKLQELSSSIVFAKKQIEGYMVELYKGFLTEEELKNVFKGEDIHLNRKQIIRRLKKIKRYTPYETIRGH